MIYHYYITCAGQGVQVDGTLHDAVASSNESSSSSAVVVPRSGLPRGRGALVSQLCMAIKTIERPFSQPSCKTVRMGRWSIILTLEKRGRRLWLPSMCSGDCPHSWVSKLAIGKGTDVSGDEKTFATDVTRILWLIPILNLQKHLFLVDSRSKLLCLPSHMLLKM